MPTGINLPGEVSGVLRNPAQWSHLSLSMISFGQEISATALQVANAYAAMANDGLLLRPYIIKRIVSDNGEIVKEFGPKVIRRVVSPTTARQVGHILSLVVKNGTGIKTSIEGLSIAGKTGTAQKSFAGQGICRKFVCLSLCRVSAGGVPATLVPGSRGRTPGYAFRQ